MTIYDFTVQAINGNPVHLSAYEGKVLLIVNTATGCGFTPQYKDLQALYEKYKDKGLEILDFPCNQFGNQAPGSETEIENFCTTTYKTTFPRFQKVKVNGSHTAPLFTWLKKEKGGLLGGQIKWNFTKFLVNKEGEVIARFAPATSPQKLETQIVALLEK